MSTETPDEPLKLQELAINVQARVDRSVTFPKVILQSVSKALSRLAKTSVELDVPTEIARAIRSGQLVRTGGVVRDNAGRIRHILQDAGKAKAILKSPILVLFWFSGNDRSGVVS